MTTDTTKDAQPRSSFKAKALAKWRELAIRSAQGEHVDDEELARAAAFAGRPGMLLDADIATVKQRMAAKENMATAQANLDQLREEQRTLQADETEFKQWREEHKQEAERRARAIRDRKELHQQAETKARREFDRSADTLKRTAAVELSEQEQAIKNQGAGAAAAIAHVADVRRRMALAAETGADRRSTLEAIREAKLDPENFKLAE